MSQDCHALTIKTDKLLLTYGAAMYEKHGSKRRSEISYKLKSIAKLLEAFQESTGNESSNAFNLIDPNKSIDKIRESKDWHSKPIPDTGIFP